MRIQVITPRAEGHDVIIVGSGAAGGMAGYQLATAGLKVLLLEAGRALDPFKEFKTMEWPYASPERGGLPAAEHSLTAAEYRMVDRPYGTARQFERFTKVFSYAGTRYTKHSVVDEREHPFTGTPYAWVRARVLGGKTNFWGRVALRLSDYDFKARTHDGFGEDWPIGYADVAPYYDRVDRLLGISGTTENLPQLPDSIYQRPVKLNCGEMILRKAIAPMGRRLIPCRAGVTTDGVASRYRRPCKGRGRCERGCNLHASFNSPTALVLPAQDTGNLELRPNSTVSEVLVDPDTGAVSGVRVIDSVTRDVYDFRSRIVVLAASTLETTRLLLNSKSRQHPQGLANSSGVIGHYLCEHLMGPGAAGFLPILSGREASNDDGRPTAAYIARFRNLTEKDPRFIRGYGFQGGSGCGPYPGYAASLRGFGASLKARVRELYPAPVNIGAFGEVLPRYENSVEIDPDVRDAWGVPVLRFNYRFGDNELAMAKDMADTAEEMLRAAGCESIYVNRGTLTEGWSIHEVGTARMGADPKRSVTNAFGQAHDVKNLFLVDGSTFVSAGCQNPTWTILALAWRASDYIVDEARRGNL